MRKLFKKVFKKLLKAVLKTFVRIDKIPFTDNGRSAEYCTMYVFGLAITSNIYSRENY